MAWRGGGRGGVLRFESSGVSCAGGGVLCGVLGRRAVCLSSYGEFCVHVVVAMDAAQCALYFCLFWPSVQF